MRDHQFVPRSDYNQVRAYRPDRPEVEIDLADSTNQWGTAPSALAALASIAPRDLIEYPPVDSLRLRRAFASHAGVDPVCVISGCGSDDLLDAALRGLAVPGESVAYPWPTFAIIPMRVRANALKPIPIPTLPSGDVDVDAILAVQARVTYLCTPNNPTGIPHSRRAVERVIAEAAGVVILDEAYAEFADECHTGWASKAPHVFVTRTMSKSFGLAGMRIGFGVGQPALIGEVLKARGPYRVTTLADRAATAALENDREWMRTIAADVRVVRERFSKALRDMGLEPFTSQGNFVCVPVANANALVEKLYAHRIAVRGFVSLPGMGDVLRIGLAPWPVLERVLDALARVLTEN